MNDLLDKFHEYRQIVNYRLLYELEDGTVLEFKLKQTDFPHLIGLHKLVDIPIIRQFNDKQNKTVSAKFLIQKIKQEKLLNEQIVKRSAYFPLIEDRYDRFGKEALLSVSYSDAIVDFNAKQIGSNLSADYILFEHKEKGYNHLCVAKDETSNRYAESFFYNEKDVYLREQKIVKVKKVTIYDNKDKIYITDYFNS